jgi:hypothetical protein
MNFVLKDPILNRFTVYSVVRAENEYRIRYLLVDDGGNLLGRLMYQSFPFATDASDCEKDKALREVVSRVKKMVKLKIRKREWQEVHDVPAHIASFLVTSEDPISNSQMVSMINAARHERYVVFRDVGGIEDLFDAGVQYLALDTGNPDTLDVFDRFGEIKACFKARFASVEMTEDGKELAKKEASNARKARRIKAEAERRAADVAV